LCLLKFSILFFFSFQIRFLLFFLKTCWLFGLSKFMWLLKNSETLDLCSFKCYKRLKKISTSKIKIQKKNDKWNTYRVYNSDAGKMVMGSDFRKFITINWYTIFVRFQCPNWDNILKFQWFKFQISVCIIKFQINL